MSTCPYHSVSNARMLVQLVSRTGLAEIFFNRLALHSLLAPFAGLVSAKGSANSHKPPPATGTHAHMHTHTYKQRFCFRLETLKSLWCVEGNENHQRLRGSS